jgi:hypothetical protein
LIKQVFGEFDALATGLDEQVDVLNVSQEFSDQQKSGP